MFLYIIFLCLLSFQSIAGHQPDDMNRTRRSLNDEKPFILPIFIYTAIFGAIFCVGPLLVRHGPNVGIARCCIMMSAFCCWIFLTTTYIVQMNPLLGPRLDNKTLAWVGHKWGVNPRSSRLAHPSTTSESSSLNMSSTEEPSL